MASGYPINLQFFAQEKTEKATPNKRKEVRKKGQVAKSSEVPTALVLLLVFALLFFIGEWMNTSLQAMFRHSFTHYTQWDMTINSVSTVFQQMTFEATKAVVPVMLIALVAGIFGNYLQVGFLFSTDSLKMKLERVNPLKGIKRIFSSRALVELGKSIFKICLIGSVVFLLIWAQIEEIFLLSQKSVGNAVSLIGQLTVQIGIIVAIILLFLSILDYLYQRYDFEKKNRMSKQDVKDEHKKIEGDPLFKSKIKERQKQMAMGRMMQEVPQADVVITNPVHFAVTIKYDPDEMDAPIVTAKGKDYLAFKIKDIAEANGVVVLENKPLARALYQQVGIGDSVPEDLFKAVAEVLAYVYRMQGRV